MTADTYMKGRITKILLAATVFFALISPVPAAALDLPQVKETAKSAATQAGLSGVESDQSIATIIGNIISGLLGVLGIVFFILLIYGGAIWMTASGDTAKVDKAKKILTSAIIGLVIIMVAYAVTSFIVDRVQEKIFE